MPLIVIVPFCPWLTAPPVQVTVICVVPAFEHVKRLVVFSVTPVMPVGSVSTTLMPVAFAVPMLLTVSV